MDQNKLLKSEVLRFERLGKCSMFRDKGEVSFDVLKVEGRHNSGTSESWIVATEKTGKDRNQKHRKNGFIFTLWSLLSHIS